MDLLTLLNKLDVVAYRPQMNAYTGGVTATILLQQIIFRYVNNKFKPFYKFKQSCKSRLYKEGDSWIEELGFSVCEFNSAIRKLKDNNFVTTKVDAQRLTWYSINEDVVIELLVKLQPKEVKVPVKKCKPIVKSESDTSTDFAFRYELPKSERVSIETKSEQVSIAPPEKPINAETAPILYNAGDLSELAIDIFKWLQTSDYPDKHGIDSAFHVVKHLRAHGLKNNPLFLAYQQK